MSGPSIEPQNSANGLQPIFRPRSIAVIGAGREPSSMSGRLFRNLLGAFRGPVYPINPKTPEILSIPTFPTILDVPEPIDLAFVAVPVASVLKVVRECGLKGVRGLVVITAGFSEIGDAGKRLEREVLDVVRAAGIRMIGPNCFGVSNTDSTVQLYGTFAGLPMPRGNIGICSQSGALGAIIPEYLRRCRQGVSTFASIGNKADVSENDLVQYWLDDPATEVVLLYLESFADPKNFRKIAAEVSRRKPIVALKSARTMAGTRAASSHTAALAGADHAADALFLQSGVLRVETLQELFDVASLLASQPLPKGPRVAILTNAGGPAILCADTLAGHGLTVPELSLNLQSALHGLLRPEAGVTNPIDLIGTIDADAFRRCLELLMDSDEVDAVVTIYVPREPGTSPAVARAVHQVTREHARGKTSLAVFMQSEMSPAELIDETLQIPCYVYPEAAARALAYAWKHAECSALPTGEIPGFSDFQDAECRRLVDQVLARAGSKGAWLRPDEVQSLLTACGLYVPRWKVVHSPDEAVAIADEWQAPVAIKIVSPGVLHKSDAGGVVVNVAGKEQVCAAYRQVTSVVAGTRDVLVQEHVSGGRETFVGVTCDPQFGHLIAFGCGGVLVELMHDIAWRLHPLTDQDAEQMIWGVRTSAMLAGYRGEPAADVMALKQVLLRVSALVALAPEIAELDLNPVKVLAAGGGARILDGRIRVAPLKDLDDF